MSNKRSFKTETKKLLDIVIHSLYTHKEIFLRELISNSVDAINKLKFLALTETEILKSDEMFKINISIDKKNKTISVKDNGIGMTSTEIIQNLGTIARSGTKKYLEKLSNKDINHAPELIGQFGVGFYSSFMVADKIEVKSKSYRGEKGVIWTSSVENYAFTVDEFDKSDKGTEVVLHLKKDAEEFLEEFKIRELVKKYSDYIEYPIEFEKNGKPEQINSQKAIWLKNKEDISGQEYKDFYQSLTYDFTDPLNTIHYRAEGTHEFSVLAYIPSKKPMSMFFEDHGKSGISLYVRRVLIVSHSKDILPPYMRFISGVVESSDLPLNISREMLQENRKLIQIKKNLTRKIYGELKMMKEKEQDKYEKFFINFGSILKEGLVIDRDNKEKLLDLMIFETTKTEKEKYIDLSTYIKNMPKEQKEIYFIIAENKELIERSPSLEYFRKKDYEVIYFYTGIDELFMQELDKYEDINFKNVSDENLEIEKTDDFKKKEEESKGLIEFIKDTLKEYIKEVKLSNRLVDSPVCFVREKGSLSYGLEKIFKSTDQLIPQQKRVLEINPDHKLINKIKSLFDNDRSDPKLTESILLLHDIALIEDGERPKDPVGFANKISNLLLHDID